MAIRGFSKEIVDDINFKVATAVDKGTLLTYDTTNAGFVKQPTGALGTSSPSGERVAGLLMIDVVDKDFNAVPQNHQKLETGLSGVVRLLKVGEIRSDVLDPSDTFAVGDTLYITHSGKISNSQITGHQEIGTALGPKDSDGFLHLYLSLE